MVFCVDDFIVVTLIITEKIYVARVSSVASGICVQVEEGGAYLSEDDFIVEEDDTIRLHRAICSKRKFSFVLSLTNEEIICDWPELSYLGER